MSSRPPRLISLQVGQQVGQQAGGEGGPGGVAATSAWPAGQHAAASKQSKQAPVGLPHPASTGRRQGPSCTHGIRVPYIDLSSPRSLYHPAHSSEDTGSLLQRGAWGRQCSADGAEQLHGRAPLAVHWRMLLPPAALRHCHSSTGLPPASPAASLLLRTPTSPCPPPLTSSCLG